MVWVWVLLFLSGSQCVTTSQKQQSKLYLPCPFLWCGEVGRDDPRRVSPPAPAWGSQVARETAPSPGPPGWAAGHGSRAWGRGGDARQALDSASGDTSGGTLVQCQGQGDQDKKAR